MKITKYTTDTNMQIDFLLLKLTMKGLKENNFVLMPLILQN